MYLARKMDTAMDFQLIPENVLLKVSVYKRRKNGCKFECAQRQNAYGRVML